MPVVDALSLMRNKKIRRMPVVIDGKMIGIVSDADLLNASPSPATSLSVWEINYLLSKITVREVMTKNVLTVTEATPIEEAALIMADNKIGGLPVLKDDELVGIITETDLFKIFLELMGARQEGVRLTAMIPEQPGTLARLTQAIAGAGGNFIAFGVFRGKDPSKWMLTFRVEGLNQAQVQELIEPIVLKITDIRTCCP
jgi:acetoin utilization protein AcuB